MFKPNEKQYRFIDKALRWVFPEKCSVCGKIIPINEDYCLCSRNESVKISDDFCRHCGNDTSNCVCSIKNAVILPEIAGVYIYSGKIRADILNLKFKNRKRLALRLGTEMAERCAKVYSDIDFDIVTFVPMTEKSLDVRLYNQSELLANQVGKLLFTPVSGLFVKTRETRTQHTLGGKERLENLKNSVKLSPGENVKGKNILICDDIKTTGSTLNQCVEVLKNHGAEKICCICVAISDFSL